MSPASISKIGQRTPLVFTQRHLNLFVPCTLATGDCPNAPKRRLLTHFQPSAIVFTHSYWLALQCTDYPSLANYSDSPTSTNPLLANWFHARACLRSEDCQPARTRTLDTFSQVSTAFHLKQRQVRCRRSMSSGFDCACAFSAINASKVVNRNLALSNLRRPLLAACRLSIWSGNYQCHHLHLNSFTASSDHPRT